MRLVLLLLAFVFALPAQGQAQFVAACAASSGGAEMGVDLGESEVCGCAAERAMTAGVAAADLDAFAAFVGEGGSPDASDVPEGLRGVFDATLSALTACATEEGLRRMAGTVAEAEAEEGGAKGTKADKAAVPAAAARAASAARMTRTAPAGFSLGDGRGAVRATQAGPGAAVRIVE